jgi:hypothetical protein
MRITAMDGRELVVLPVEDFERLSQGGSIDPARSGNIVAEIMPPAVFQDIMSGYSPVEAWRRHRGFSQSRLASMSGVSRYTIIRMEASGVGAGNPMTRRRVASALGVSLNAI